MDERAAGSDDGDRARERRWVERARAGDDEALASLVTALSPSLFRFARRFTADAARAEDLVQETWVRAHAALGRFDGARALRPWLYRIAANLAISEARRRRRRAEQPLAEDGEAGGDGAGASGRGGRAPGAGAARSSGLGALAAAERAEAVRRAVDALPPIYRAVSVLYYLGEMALAEVAEALEIPEGTAKVRLFRARALLRGRLAGWIEGDEGDEVGREAAVAAASRGSGARRGRASGEEGDGGRRA